MALKKILGFLGDRPFTSYNLTLMGYMLGVKAIAVFYEVFNFKLLLLFYSDDDENLFSTYIARKYDSFYNNI